MVGNLCDVFQKPCNSNWRSRATHGIIKNRNSCEHFDLIFSWNHVVYYFMGMSWMKVRFLFYQERNRYLFFVGFVILPRAVVVRVILFLYKMLIRSAFFTHFTQCAPDETNPSCPWWRALDTLSFHNFQTKDFPASPTNHVLTLVRIPCD